MTLYPGATIAGYRIVRLVGAGGMGAVYLARHPRLPRNVALKVIEGALGTDRSFRQRFDREAELAARLDHPNIVRVYDRGVDGDRPWISMQYVDGVDAKALVRAPIDRVLFIVGEAAKGLDHAHGAGLLHRDVKPANILVARGDDGTDRVLVTDFGIARSLDDSTALTATGSLVATLAYAAPELIAGRPVDARIDVYALGCTLFEMLTGTVPFPYQSPGAVLAAHLDEPPPRHPAIPPQLNDVIARAMAKNPADRFPDCASLRSALVREPHPAADKHHARGVVVLLAVLAVVAVAVLVGFAVTRDDTAAPIAVTTPAPPPSTTTTTATTAAATPWGPEGYVAALFPGLLPTSPELTGYRGLLCDSARRDAEFGPVDSIECRDTAGVDVTVECAQSKTPITQYFFYNGTRDIGDERWTRPSGSGQLRWGSDDGGFGYLSVLFDDTARNFCDIHVSGSGTGQQLHDDWWKQAPI